jgi:hypothetical protein
MLSWTIACDEGIPIEKLFHSCDDGRIGFGIAGGREQSLYIARYLQGVNPMKFLIGMLRLLRVLVGLLGGTTFISGCTAMLNTDPQAIGKLVIGFVCLMLFGALRWVINRLHIAKYGERHPALTNDWNL